MAITYDPTKRNITLADRGLDFAESGAVLDGAKFQFVDDRFDYGEVRMTTVGFLHGRITVVVWTSRGEDRHVFSMRKANDKEQRRYEGRLG